MSTKIFGSSKIDAPVWIGIDQSYSGFAITALDADDNYYTEVEKLEGDTDTERLYRARSFLLGFLDRHLVEGIAMEGYAFGSQTANMAGELGGTVKLALFDRYRFDNPSAAFPLIVPPTSLKKYATGKGAGVPKHQIILHSYKKWGVEFNEDNAADSYVLARMARGKHNLAYETEVIDKLLYPKAKTK